MSAARRVSSWGRARVSPSHASRPSKDAPGTRSRGRGPGRCRACRRPPGRPGTSPAAPLRRPRPTAAAPRARERRGDHRAQGEAQPSAAGASGAGRVSIHSTVAASRPKPALITKTRSPRRPEAPEGGTRAPPGVRARAASGGEVARPGVVGPADGAARRRSRSRPAGAPAPRARRPARRPPRPPCRPLPAVTTTPGALGGGPGREAPGVPRPRGDERPLQAVGGQRPEPPRPAAGGWPP